MPDYVKTFSYEVEGLSYTVSLYEEGGAFFADVTVLEGSMDLNALYYGDEDFSGSSENLGGALNLNGAQLDGEKVQWDDAIAISDPGLGPEGEEKETFLAAGDTFTIPLDEIDSLDEIDVVGIRATSTSTEEGSIKGVSDDPEEPEEPDAVYDKLFFGEVFTESGDPYGGVFVLAEEPVPNEFGVPSLPEGTEPTFENYLSYFETDLAGDVTQLESVVFYENDEEGIAQELFRLDAPDGGFADSDALLMAYDDFIAAQSAETDSALELMAALSLSPADSDAMLADQLAEDGGDEDMADIL